jgi:hypothetical protein
MNLIQPITRVVRSQPLLFRSSKMARVSPQANWVEVAVSSHSPPRFHNQSDAFIASDMLLSEHRVGDGLAF